MMSLAYFRMKFSSLKMNRERVFVAAMPGRLMFVARFAMFLSEASGLPPRLLPSLMPPASDVRFAILLNESIVRERHGNDKSLRSVGGHPLTFQTAAQLPASARPVLLPYTYSQVAVSRTLHVHTHIHVHSERHVGRVGWPANGIVNDGRPLRRCERLEQRTSAGETESCTAMTSTA